MQTLVGSLEKRIMAQHRANEASQRLETIPGIGFIGATAIEATVTDPTAFRSGRDFAAWIGLVPRQDSTGGKQKLGPISKQGDRYLRRLLVVGAHASLALREAEPGKISLAHATSGATMASLSFVECRVTDNGTGEANTRPPGHGLKIVEALAKSLGGTSDQRFGPHGATAVLIFPVEIDTAERLA